MNVSLPADFDEFLQIDNAPQRFEEARRVAERSVAAGIPLMPNLDHAAIFTDPPHLVAGPLKRRGYLTGWDTRCYPSPVDGHDYINVSARLPSESTARANGWFDYAAIVHPVDEPARDHMLGQGYGNPFIHHLTWGIVPPPRGADDDFTYAGRLVSFMAETRRKMAAAIGEDPGTLIAALPPEVRANADFDRVAAGWVADMAAGEFQFEAMQGGGFLIQFFVLTGGRIEVALRVGTKQTFNPKSVHKISTDEISAVQDDAHPPVM